jgi:hypothetical protein
MLFEKRKLYALRKDIHFLKNRVDNWIGLAVTSCRMWQFFFFEFRLLKLFDFSEAIVTPYIRKYRSIACPNEAIECTGTYKKVHGNLIHLVFAIVSFFSRNKKNLKFKFMYNHQYHRIICELSSCFFFCI